MEIYVQNVGSVQNGVVICSEKHRTGSRWPARSFSAPKPLQIQEIEKNLAEKTRVCYNQHRKILVKPAEGWYEEKTA